MPIMNFPGADGEEDVLEQLAEISKLLNFLLNGMLDVTNIRAKSLTADVIKAGSITADEMTVTELSAITANLGHILAGLIESVEIYGSYIATARGAYPRAEMSSAEDLFAAYATADNFLKIFSLESGTPMVYFSNLSSIARLFLNGSNLSLATFGTLLLSATGDITIQSTNSSSDVILKAGTSGYVTVDAWSKLFSTANAQTLQSALNAKANNSGISGSFKSTDGKTITISNGVVVSMV